MGSLLKEKITKFFQQLCSHGLGMKLEGNGHFLHYNYNIRLLFLKSRTGAREMAQHLREQANFQPPQGSSQWSVTPVLEDPTSSSSLHRHQAHKWYKACTEVNTHTQTQTSQEHFTYKWTNSIWKLNVDWHVYVLWFLILMFYPVMTKTKTKKKTQTYAEITYK